MLWYNLELSCQKEKGFEIEDFLFDYGASSVSFTYQNNNEEFYELNPDETPLWELVKINAIFEKKISINDIHKILEKSDYSNLVISSFKDRDWIKTYQKCVVPMQFGEKIWIIPSWVEHKPNPGDIVIEMDPGQAFGSGSHETTSLCLEYLDVARLEDKVIIDYGCGSGILAIAALKLGAKFCYAFDIDNSAIEVCKKNSDNNKVEDKIFIGNDKNIELENISDFLIANIFSSSLVSLKDRIISLCKQDSILILSGILDNQVEHVLTAFEKDFELVQNRYRNEWHLLELKKL